MEISMAETQANLAMDFRFATQENLERYCEALSVVGRDAPSVREALLGLASLSLLQDAQLYANQLGSLEVPQEEILHMAH